MKPHIATAPEPAVTRNLRGWGRVCEADPTIVERLISKVRSTGS